MGDSTSTALTFPKIQPTDNKSYRLGIFFNNYSFENSLELSQIQLGELYSINM